MNEYQKIYDQLAVCANPGVHENFVDGFESTELMRHNTPKYEDVRISLKDLAPEYLINEPTEIDEKYDDHKKFYEQTVEYTKTGSHAKLAEDSEIAELMRYNTLKLEDEQNRSKEFADCKKEGQNDNFEITDKSLIPERLFDAYPETAEKTDDYKKFYEQFAGNTKPRAHENFEDGSNTSELARFNTFKLEDEQNGSKMCIGNKKEGQNCNYDIIGETTVPECLQFEKESEPKNHMEARFNVSV